MNGSNGPSDAVPAAESAFAPLRNQIRPALAAMVALTLLTGCVFPLVLFGLGTCLFPDQAAGSLVTNHGAIAGSRLIGQSFTQPAYFQPRPSAAGNGYDATQSGGTNYGPANPKLIDAVREAARDFRIRNGLPADATVPIDAVTSSGSGLDPHISPENAALQVPRVARERGVGEELVRRLVAEHTEGRQAGFIGAPQVSVLDLNLALDQAAPLPHR
jgi:K+-transporting ATPase ATPase C chain